MTELAEGEEPAVDREQRSPGRAELDLALAAPLLERLGPQRHLPPDHPPGRRVDAGERGVALIAAVETVEMAVVVDRGVEVQGELGGRPDDLVGEVGKDPEQGAAGTVAGGDEDLVVEHHRTGGVDGLIGPAAERKREVHGAVRRVDRQETPAGRRRLAAREHEDPALAVHVRGHRGGVAGAPVAGPPELAAGAGVEGDHAGAARCADVHDHAAVLDQGRRRGAEEVLAHAVLGLQIATPEAAAGGQVESVQPALGPESEHAAALDDRARARAVVVAVTVPVAGGIAEVPLQLAGLGVAALDHLPVAHPMEEQQAVSGDGG